MNMPDIRSEILNKYTEFNEFLMSISLDGLRSSFSRQDLNEFKGELYNIKLRSLAYEISDMTEQMKLEEFPELLGVHHYPVLKEITFMTEEEKKKLDEQLIRFRVGDYVSGLWRYTKKEKELEEFLLEHKVISKRYIVDCNCEEYWLSDVMSQDEKEKLETIINKENYEDADYEHYHKMVHSYCDECGDDCDLDYVKQKFKNGHMRFKEMLRMDMERDSSLDNV